MLAIVSMVLVACGGGNKKEIEKANIEKANIEKVKGLSYSIFDYFNNYQKDSLMMLMPNIDYDYCDFLNDSIRITSVNPKDSCYEVQLIKNYSPNSIMDFNEKKSMSLEFEKTENNPFGFVVTDSRGFTETNMLPAQLEYSGAIKENRKYSDKEYKELLALADPLLQRAVEKATKEINESVKIMLPYHPSLKTRPGAAWNRSVKFNELRVSKNPIWKEAMNDSRYNTWEDADLTQPKPNHTGQYMAIAYVHPDGRGWFDVKLINNTNYDINGGVLHFTIYKYVDGEYEDFNNKSFWNADGLLEPLKTIITGKDNKLKANETHKYRMTVDPDGQKIIQQRFGYYYWIERISFSITPEDVLRYTPIDQLFDGSEYDTYLTQNTSIDNSQSNYEVKPDSSCKQVIINADKLRFRLGPSTEAEVFTTSEGKTFYPNKGDKFNYRGEAGDFYKIEYNGQELYVSKQHTILE